MKLGLIVLSCLLLTNCGPESYTPNLSKPEVVAKKKLSPWLKADDFTQLKSDDLKKENVLENIYWWNFANDFRSEPETTSDNMDFKCTNNLKLKGGMGYVEGIANKYESICMYGADQKLTTTGKFYIRITCEGKDFSKIKGDFPTLAKLDLENCKTYSLTLNMETSYRETFTNSAEVYTGINKSAIMNADGSACNGSITNKVFSMSECSAYDYSEESRNNTKSLTILNQENLKLDFSNDAGMWYDAGEIALSVNNWQGKVTYNTKNTSPIGLLSSGNETFTFSISEDSIVEQK